MRACAEVVEETEEGDDEFDAEILPERVSRHIGSTELLKLKLGTLVVLSRSEADVFYEPALSALSRSGVVDRLHSLIGLSHLFNHGERLLEIDSQRKADHESVDQSYSLMKSYGGFIHRK